MNIIFEVTGGIGKNIMATVIVKLLKQKYPDKHLTVIASSPEVFFNNPNIDSLLPPDVRGEIYNLVTPTTKMYLHDPYLCSDFVTKKENIYKVWAKLCEVEYNDEQPELFLTENEENEYSAKFDTSKPILTIHPNGGPIDINPTHLNNTGYNWVRDIPRITSNEIIEKYKDKYNIYQIKHSSQKITLKGVKVADNPIREIMVLLKLSKKRVLIDSFSQHMAAALGLKSTVLWIGTSVDNFGYSLHKNVKAEEFTKLPYYTTYVGFHLAEPLNYMPYKSTTEIFNINKILK